MNVKDKIFVKVIANWTQADEITKRTNKFLDKLRDKGAVLKQLHYSYGSSSSGVMIEYYADKNVDDEE